MSTCLTSPSVVADLPAEPDDLDDEPLSDDDLADRRLAAAEDRAEWREW